MIDTCLDSGRYEDSPEFCHEKTVRAKKEYHCCECGEVIRVGDSHEYVSGKWDGEILTFRTCRICAAVRSDFFTSWMYGTLWEDMWEAYGLGYDSIDEDREDRDWPDKEWAAWVKNQEEIRRRRKERRW